MSIDNDKRELLKLKQGLIDSSESIDESGYGAVMPSTFKEKLINWLWHSKTVIITMLIIISLGFVVWYYFFVAEKSDIEIYSAGNYTVILRQLIEKNGEKYCQDYDKNGKVKISIRQAGEDEVLGYTDLYSQIENGKASIYIGKKDKLTALYDDYINAKNEVIFSDLKEITGEEGYLIDVSKTQFGKDLKLFTTEVFIAVRKDDSESEKQAIEFLSNLYNGKTYLRD